MNLTKTQRSYTNVETREKLYLYQDQANRFHLLHPKPTHPDDPAEGTEVNGFYICAHSGITIKINKTKFIKLDMGEFYHMKAGEVITHKKFEGFDKFTKA